MVAWVRMKFPRWKTATGQARSMPVGLAFAGTWVACIFALQIRVVAAPVGLAATMQPKTPRLAGCGATSPLFFLRGKNAGRRAMQQSLHTFVKFSPIRPGFR
jgi:hypothetical protein